MTTQETQHLIHSANKELKPNFWSKLQGIQEDFEKMGIALGISVDNYKFINSFNEISPGSRIEINIQFSDYAELSRMVLMPSKISRLIENLLNLLYSNGPFVRGSIDTSRLVMFKADAANRNNYLSLLFSHSLLDLRVSIKNPEILNNQKAETISISEIGLESDLPTPMKRLIHLLKDFGWQQGVQIPNADPEHYSTFHIVGNARKPELEFAQKAEKLTNRLFEINRGRLPNYQIFTQKDNFKTDSRIEIADFESRYKSNLTALNSLGFQVLNLDQFNSLSSENPSLYNSISRQIQASCNSIFKYSSMERTEVVNEAGDKRLNKNPHPFSYGSMLMDSQYRLIGHIFSYGTTLAYLGSTKQARIHFNDAGETLSYQTLSLSNIENLNSDSVILVPPGFSIFLVHSILRQIQQDTDQLVWGTFMTPGPLRQRLEKLLLEKNLSSYDQISDEDLRILMLNSGANVASHFPAEIRGFTPVRDRSSVHVARGSDDGLNLAKDDGALWISPRATVVFNKLI
ncbi:MAG: hypothetical protein OHK0017_01140 [Patescibacteria group bacterium]